MDGTMARKRHKPEEIVAKLRQVDVLTGQGKSIAEASSALNAIGLNPTVQVDQGCSGGTVASQSIVGDQPQKSPISLRYCGG